jgi:hypothetical protein
MRDAYRPAGTDWDAADVDDVLDDSFPASDPPSWSTLRSGPPRERAVTRASSSALGTTPRRMIRTMSGGSGAGLL